MDQCDPIQLFILCVLCFVIGAVIAGTVGYALGRRGRM